MTRSKLSYLHYIETFERDWLEILCLIHMTSKLTEISLTSKVSYFVNTPVPSNATKKLLAIKFLSQ